MLSLIIFIIINITIIVIFYAIAKPIFHVITGMKKILHLMMPFNASNKFIVYNLHGHVFLWLFFIVSLEASSEYRKLCSWVFYSQW